MTCGARWIRAGVLIAGYIALRWWIPQWLWVVWIGCFGLWLRRLAGRATSDPAVSRIVMAGYAVRVGLALALFAISLWHLPFASELQVGRGFWSFSGDAAYYDDAAHQTVHAWATGTPVSRQFWERRFILWVSLLYALVGPYPLNGVLVNVFVGSLIPLLGMRLLGLFTAKRRAHQLCVALLAFWPSLLLWSTQLLKDVWVVAGILLVLYAVSELSRRVSSGTLGRQPRRAGLLMAAALAGWWVVASLRTYPGAILFAAFAAAFGCWWFRTLWVERRTGFVGRRQSLVLFAVVAFGAACATVISAVDFVGLAVKAPSQKIWQLYGKDALNQTTGAVLTQLEQLVVQSPDAAVSAGAERLVARATAIVADRMRAEGRPMESIDTEGLTRVAAELLNDPTVFSRSLISNRFGAQAVQIIREFRPTVIEPYVYMSLSKLNDRRIGYAQGQGAMACDRDVRIDHPLGFIRHIPRAMVQALFGPLPSLWRGAQARMYVGEMALIYVLSPGLCFVVYALWRRRELHSWFLLAYLLLMPLLFGMVIANLGILFRLRLMFLVPWLALLPLLFVESPDKAHG